MTDGTGVDESQQQRRAGRRRKQTGGPHSPALAPVESGVPRSDQPPLKLIRFRTVRDRTGLSRSTIWRLQRTGAFPKHHRISANAVAWVEQDVVDWMKAKASVR